MTIRICCAAAAVCASFLTVPAFAADEIPVTGWVNFMPAATSIKDCKDNKTIKIFQSDQILRNLVDDAERKGFLVKIDGGSVVYARVKGRIINNTTYCPYLANKKGCIAIMKIVGLSDPKKSNPCP